MMLAILVFNKQTYFQIVSLMLLSLITAAMLAHSNVFESKKQNKVEILNEFLVYSCMWSSIVYSIDLPDGSKDLAGWSQILTGLGMIFVSIIISFYDQFGSIATCYKNCMKKRKKRANEKQFLALHKFVSNLDETTY
jgi:hypothetical protein